MKDTPEGEELNYELMQRLRDFPDPEDNFKIQEDTTKIERDGGVDNKTKEATERQKQKTESKQMNDLEPSQNDSNTSQSSTEIHLQEEATKIFEEGGPALREKLDQLLEQIGVTGDQEIDLESMEKKMKESGLDMRDVAASLGLKI